MNKKIHLKAPRHMASDSRRCKTVENIFFLKKHLHLRALDTVSVKSWAFFGDYLLSHSEKSRKMMKGKMYAAGSLRTFRL